MDNNDILIRLRYALDISDKKMVQIFEQGGVTVSRDDVAKLLSKTEESYNYDEVEDGKQSNMTCTNAYLEGFLNGLIVEKRGVMKDKDGKVMKPPMLLKEGDNPNNVLLKKVKIALNLDSDGMHQVFEKAGVTVSKAEMGAFFRKEDHKHYRHCMDKYARSFLKGLTLTYRGKK